MNDARIAPALSAKDIALRYEGTSVSILEGFNVDVASSEIVSIIGPSGVGKSSLLRVLAGLQTPDRGTVETHGRRVEGVHPRLAVAFQNPCLLPWLDLSGNVSFGLDFARQPIISKPDRKARVDAAIRDVGLTHASRMMPGSLSGGMAQRASLARCLARRPEVLLLDEPFAALDVVTRAEMQRLMTTLVREYRVAAVLVTHDIDEAILVSDRVLLLGGSPASCVGEWRISTDNPRDDRAAETQALRSEIVARLRTAIKTH